MTQWIGRYIVDWNKVEVLHVLCDLRYDTNKSTSVIGVSLLNLSFLNAILFPWIDKGAGY